MSNSILDNIPDGKRLLALSREELAGYVMEHLHSLNGNPLQQQHPHPNNLAINIAEFYPQSIRDDVRKAIFSTCKWLVKKDFLAETNDQGFYEKRYSPMWFYGQIIGGQATFLFLPHLPGTLQD